MKLVKVFVSYAHESKEFRETVLEMVNWLREKGKGKIQIAFDLDYQYKAPARGWQVWMEDQIEIADIVIMVCTPKYLKRFRKQEIGSGKGVTWEGAIITQDLYDSNIHNEKFVPIIPDGGSDENIPRVLKGFFNYLSFPSQNESILACILTDIVGMAADDASIQGGSLSKASQPLDMNQIQVEIVETFNITGAEIVNRISQLEILVRAFLQLNEVQKISIAKQLDVYEDHYNLLAPQERYKQIFNKINENQLLADLWDKINIIQPFANQPNPFKF